jgi:hypothetical protein
MHQLTLLQNLRIDFKTIKIFMVKFVLTRIPMHQYAPAPSRQSELAP